MKTQIDSLGSNAELWYLRIRPDNSQCNDMLISFFQQSFLPRGAMLAWYMLSSCVCPSVRPSVCQSVTSQHCTKMAKYRITLTTTYDSPGTLIFWCQRSRRNSDGVIPNEGAKYTCGKLKSAIFDQYLAIFQNGGASCRHGYYGTLIGSRMSSIDWCYFRWPWMTITTPNHPILFRLTYLRSEWS